MVWTFRVYDITVIPFRAFRRPRRHESHGAGEIADYLQLVKQIFQAQGIEFKKGSGTGVQDIEEGILVEIEER